jgi:N-acetylglucosaminyldiphosphoundecaprenol N-acetyl-beta-D-mannosaminyltransferase
MLGLLPTEKKQHWVTILGVPIINCGLDQGIHLIEHLIDNRKSQLVVFANAHTLNLAHERLEYQAVLKNAAMVLRDGVGVAWAIKKKGFVPLHNFVGTDFLPEFFNRTVHKGYRVFLLGSKPGIAKKAAEKLTTWVPGLIIAGYDHGYFKDHKSDQIIDRINATHSDILLVAMGNPKQELWIARHLNRLNVPVCMGVGALFDYFGGFAKRAPRWMLNANMEWIFRLLIEPKRLWKRYCIGNPKFILRVWRD